jgi:membrane fusion protein (multidrug efflux system)
MRILQTLLILVIINSSMVYAGETPPVKVVTSKIAFQKVAQNRSFIGILYYERISNISSDVTGLVSKITVRTGDRIHKGMPLVHLDTELLEKEILFHKNQMEQASLRITHAKKNYQRMDTLFKKGGISEKDFDDAEFVYQEALLKKISMETTLEKLLIQKRKSVINAPFEGIILEKNVDSGDWVHQGKPLIRIGSVKDLFIKLSVAETLLQFIFVGQKVPVTINAYQKKMTGTIDNLFPTADAKTKNVFLKIRIPGLTKVAQNMSATVSIPTGSRKKLAMISRDALVKFQGKDFVYTIKEKKAAMLPVNIVTYLGNQVGADNAHFTEGMPVVVDGNERLRPGQSVVMVGEY